MYHLVMNGKGYLHTNLYKGEIAGEGSSREGFGLQLFPNACLFVGFWERNTANGPGMLILPDGTVFEGEYKDNNLQKGIIRFFNGAKYEGFFSGDKYERLTNGTFTFSSGDKLQAVWDDGVISAGKLIDKNRKILEFFSDDFIVREYGRKGLIVPKKEKWLYEGGLDGSKPSGNGVMFSTFQQYHSGYFDDDKISGFSKRVRINWGEICEGECQINKKIGVWTRMLTRGYEIKGDVRQTQAVVRFPYLNDDYFEGEVDINWKSDDKPYKFSFKKGIYYLKNGSEYRCIKISNAIESIFQIPEVRARGLNFENTFSRIIHFRSEIIREISDFLNKLLDSKKLSLSLIPPSVSRRLGSAFEDLSPKNLPSRGGKVAKQLLSSQSSNAQNNDASLMSVPKFMNIDALIKQQNTKRISNKKNLEANVSFENRRESKSQGVTNSRSSKRNTNITSFVQQENQLSSNKTPISYDSPFVDQSLQKTINNNTRDIQADTLFSNDGKDDIFGLKINQNNFINDTERRSANMIAQRNSVQSKFQIITPRKIVLNKNIFDVDDTPKYARKNSPLPSPRLSRNPENSDRKVLNSIFSRTGDISTLDKNEIFSRTQKSERIESEKFDTSTLKINNKSNTPSLLDRKMQKDATSIRLTNPVRTSDITDLESTLKGPVATTKNFEKKNTDSFGRPRQLSESETEQRRQKFENSINTPDMNNLSRNQNTRNSKADVSFEEVSSGEEMDEMLPINALPYKRTSSFSITMINDNGIDFFEGTLVKKKKHGFCRILYENGTYKESFFINDMMDGEGRLVYPNGISLTGSFKEDWLIGAACVCVENQTVEGNFDKGEFYGDKIIVRRNGVVITSENAREIAAGQKGSVMVYFKNNFRLACDFDNNDVVKNQKCRLYDQHGNLWIGKVMASKNEKVKHFVTLSTIKVTFKILLDTEGIVTKIGKA